MVGVDLVTKLAFQLGRQRCCSLDGVGARSAKVTAGLDEGVFRMTDIACFTMFFVYLRQISYGLH